MFNIYKNKNEAGFTLIETLVVVGIFGIILAGVLKVFDTSNYTYKVQEEVAAMQQNIRVSKMFLERDIRMAGCGIRGNFGYYGSKVYAVEFENAEGSTGTDKIYVNYIDYGIDLCEGGNVPPDLTTTSGPSDSSSVAQVEQELDASNAPYNRWVDGFTCGGVDYGGSNNPFMAIITSPDGTKSDVVWITDGQVTGVGSNDYVQNRPYPTGCGSDCNKVINLFPAGSILSFFNASMFKKYAYYVSGNVLMRDSIAYDGSTESTPIAEDIDDLQFAFGLDTNGDGFVESWVDSADLTNTEKEQVRLVRMNILGRTASEHRGVINTRQEIEDHTAGTTTDGYRRKLLQVTVKVRNLGLG